MTVLKWILTPKQRCDVELLLNGAFHPLTGFLHQSDYNSVLASMRLADGHLWPMPICLDVDALFASSVQLGDTVLLADTDNSRIATLRVTDKWQPDKNHEVLAVFGTEDKAHPGVRYVLDRAGSWYLGGPIGVVQVPRHYDFIELRFDPEQLKAQFKDKGIERIVGFQTRNPMHRAHLELTQRAALQIDGHLLLHPVVGTTKPGDIDYVTRVACYQKILPYYPPQTVTLSLLNLAMRMAGPREALWHALIRKNYGCTHFIVGRDHAGPGVDSHGNVFYAPSAAQELVMGFEKELEIKILAFEEIVYAENRKQYLPRNEVTPEDRVLTISGSELRRALDENKPIPAWFSYPELMEVLSASKLNSRHGFTILFTGLSGAGKTTLAYSLLTRLREVGRLDVTVLDGDEMRTQLGGELGFSKADRELNCHRMAYIASEITKVGGIVLCALIAPYQESRLKMRQNITQYGGFIEIYVATPMSICQKRDTKGLYKKATSGELHALTGVSDPYEAPRTPELVIDTSLNSIQHSMDTIMQYLLEHGVLQTRHKYEETA